MKLRLLILTLLTTVGTLCPAQSNMGAGTSADSVIIIRRDTMLMLRCDTVVKQTKDTLSVDQLANLFIKRNSGKKFVLDDNLANAISNANVSTDMTAQQPVVQQPVVQQPVVQTPVVQTPVVQTPVVVTPVTQQPVVQTPANQQPVLQTPVVQTPVVQTPAVPATVPVVARSAAKDDDLLPESIVDQKGRRIYRTERDIQKLTFVPRGTWFGGATVSYTEQEFDNLNYLLVKDINAKGYTFGISPFFGYFVRKNLAVGTRFTYNRTLLDIGNIDLSLGEDFKINLKDMYYLEHDYQVSAFMRTYMPLGRSKVFGFFNEMRLTYGHSQAKMLNGRYVEGTLDGTYSESNYLHIGFAPGLTAFVQDWMAVEVQMGVMGFNFKWTDQVTNQVERGTQRNFSGMFDINLFLIQIGTTIYI